MSVVTDTRYLKLNQYVQLGGNPGPQYSWAGHDSDRKDVELGCSEGELRGGIEGWGDSSLGDYW